MPDCPGTHSFYLPLLSHICHVSFVLSWHFLHQATLSGQNKLDICLSWAMFVIILNSVSFPILLPCRTSRHTLFTVPLPPLFWALFFSYLRRREEGGKHVPGANHVLPVTLLLYYWEFGKFPLRPSFRPMRGCFACTPSNQRAGFDFVRA